MADSMLSLVEQGGPDQELIIGSGPHADIVIEDASVDARHARLLCKNGQVYLRDMNSTHGTFVNGVEVRGLVAVQRGDQVQLGEATVSLGPRGTSTASPSGITLAGVSVSVSAGGERRDILSDVSARIRPGEFVGILGASGSGKSTLIRALAGLISPARGQIVFNGEPTTPSLLRSNQKIAYLPQEIVIHEALTATSALLHIARLKRVGGSDRERRELVDGVLRRVKFDGPKNLRISRLSGGQRKRVALAAELLGDPQVLLFDEVTSGLDPGSEEKMMHLFRELANEGRTVICITHFPARLTECDRLLYLMDGQAVFYGTPHELMGFFGIDAIEDVYVKQDQRTASQWRELFDRSRLRENLKTETAASADEPPATASHSPAPILEQTKQLLRRYFELQRADWRYLLLLFLQAPVIGLMVAAAFGSITSESLQAQAADTKEVVFILVLATLWCAGTASVREIVKEDTILRHEARFGIRPLPYLLSKTILLGALAVVQVVVLLSLASYFTELTGPSQTDNGSQPMDYKFLVLALTAVAGVTLGLLVSAVAGSAERAMTLLPVLLIAQAIFSSGFANLNGWTEMGSRLTVPAYSAMDGMRATFSTELQMKKYSEGEEVDEILGEGGWLASSLLRLMAQTVVLSWLTSYVLQTKLRGTKPNWLPIRRIEFSPLPRGS